MSVSLSVLIVALVVSIVGFNIYSLLLGIRDIVSRYVIKLKDDENVQDFNKDK